MGYRSDVGLALTKAGMDKLRMNLLSQDTLPQTKSAVEKLLKFADKHKADSSGAEGWYWGNVKWYNNDPLYYPEIDFIENLLSGLNGDDFRFIRIGEDYDDTEVRGDFIENPFALEILRGISFSEI